MTDSDYKIVYEYFHKHPYEINDNFNVCYNRCNGKYYLKLSYDCFFPPITDDKLVSCNKMSILFYAIYTNDLKLLNLLNKFNISLNIENKVYKAIPPINCINYYFIKKYKSSNKENLSINMFENIILNKFDIISIYLGYNSLKNTFIKYDDIIQYLISFYFNESMFTSEDFIKHLNIILKYYPHILINDYDKKIIKLIKGKYEITPEIQSNYNFINEYLDKIVDTIHKTPLDCFPLSNNRIKNSYKTKDDMIMFYTILEKDKDFLEYLNNKYNYSILIYSSNNLNYTIKLFNLIDNVMIIENYHKSIIIMGNNIKIDTQNTLNMALLIDYFIINTTIKNELMYITIDEVKSYIDKLINLKELCYKNKNPDNPLFLKNLNLQETISHFKEFIFQNDYDYFIELIKNKMMYNFYSLHTIPINVSEEIFNNYIDYLYENKIISFNYLCHFYYYNEYVNESYIINLNKLTKNKHKNYHNDIRKMIKYIFIERMNIHNYDIIVKHVNLLNFHYYITIENKNYKTDTFEVSLLHYLIYKINNPIIIKKFIDKYPELINNNDNKYKLYPIHCALLKNYLSIFNYICNKMNIQCPNCKKIQSIKYKENFNNLKEISEKLNDDIYDCYGNNMLKFCILNDCDISIVKMFLCYYNYNIYEYDINKESIILFLLRINNVKYIDVLNTLGYDINQGIVIFIQSITDLV